MSIGVAVVVIAVAVVAALVIRKLLKSSDSSVTPPVVTPPVQPDVDTPAQEQREAAGLSDHDQDDSAAPKGTEKP